MNFNINLLVLLSVCISVVGRNLNLNQASVCDMKKVSFWFLVQPKFVMAHFKLLGMGWQKKHIGQAPSTFCTSDLKVLIGRM